MDSNLSATLVQNKFLKSQYFGQQNAYEDVGIH